jgi:dTDP-4-dehydrorhamnose reductase
VKVVVLGAGGLLGRHLVEELRGHEVSGLAREACDVTDAAAVARALVGAEAVVNCAAFTDVDGAERAEEAAYRLNAYGAVVVARAARAAGAFLVHVSTDFVFDGTQAEPYDEFDAPRPLSIYARSKWAGEELVRAAGGAHALVRVQGLYGAGGRNFSSKLRALVLAQKRLKLDAERRVQPTWARSAARLIVPITTGKRSGIFHVSCAGETTWAGFANRLAARLSRPPNWDEVSTAALGSAAARPPNCLFKHRMLALEGLPPPERWEAAQDEYLAEEASKE